MTSGLPHGLGYKHRKPGVLDRASSKLRSLRVGAEFTPTVHPRFPTWFRMMGALDQGQFNACTGFGLAQGVRLDQSKSWMAPPLLSPLVPYWSARRRETGDDDYVLDNGAYVDDVVWAFNAFGSCREEHYPFIDRSRSEQTELINARPPQRVYQLALARRDTLKLKLKRIVDHGDRLLQRTAHSLHLEQVCFTAIPVDYQFLQGHDVYMTGGGPSLGYHFLALLDWRPSITGTSYDLLCGNSWGNEWGDYGTAWIAPTLTRQAQGVWYLESTKS